MHTVTTRRSPRQLIEGPGAIAAVGSIAAQLGTRALVVTDPVITGQPGWTHLVEALTTAGVGYETFADATAEVPLEAVERCVSVAREVAPDLIVALGGGTVIDLAKAAATILTHGGTPSDYYGEGLVPGPILPIIAVPTTAGTGSEVTTVAVLSDPERALKVGISSVHLVPAFGVCDPELTASCPPSVTAFAGIDAVSHAVEAFTSVRRPADWREVVEGVAIGKNDVGDEYALRAIRALAPNLVSVVEHGDDMEARAAVMRGATAAGIAFGHAGVAAPHALQYPVGAATKTPHGLGVGLLLPYVLTVIESLIADELTTLAAAVGLDDADGAGVFIDWVVRTNARIGVPRSLREIGVGRDELRGLAELTTGVTRLLRNHPGDRSADALEAILQAAWEGDRNLLR